MEQFPSRETTVLACGRAASAVVRAGPSRLAELRRDPGMKVPLSALRHVDDQSVVGLAAVLEAMRTSGTDVVSCREWGIVAAPRFFGRTALIATLRKYRTEGAWGVSPHLVPQQSQHALAGLLSHLLGIHGPSLGVGGGPGAGFEGVQAAATLLHAEGVPGVWLVITHWDPEPDLDDQNRLSPQSVCHALALALTVASETPTGACLHVRPDAIAADAFDFDVSAWLTRRGRSEDTP